MLFRFFFIGLVTSLSLFAKEENKETAKISEALGHLIGKNLDALGLKFDIDLVVQGLKDATDGKNSPMSENECIEAISLAQEIAYKEQAEGNLQKAETFLKNNAKNKGIVVIEEGKLQYKIEKVGKGPKVESHFSPLIRYVGRYLDGSTFGQSQEGEILSLDESIPGFSKGLIGMKEGEKRTLFIHPDFGYGTQGFLPPNSLLTFEIEVIKANSPNEELNDSLIIESDQEAKITKDLDTPSIR